MTEYEPVILHVYTRGTYQALAERLLRNRATVRDRVEANVVSGFLTLVEDEGRTCLRCEQRLAPTHIGAVGVLMPFDEGKLENPDGQSPVCGVCEQCCGELGKGLPKYVALAAGLIFEEGRA